MNLATPAKLINKYHLIGSIEAGKKANFIIEGRNVFTFNLSTKKRFVPFVFPKGYAMIQSEGYYAFSETYNKVIESPEEDEIAKVLKKDTELFFQISFDEYLKLGRKSLVQ